MSDAVTITFKWGEVERAISTTEEILRNPRPLLRAFSKKLTKDIKTNIKDGGTGWPPFAESTLAKMKGELAGDLGKRGKVKAEKIRAALKSMATIEKAVRSNGWSTQLRLKYARLSKRLEKYKRQEERAKKLREWRTDESLTQKQAARLLGKSKSTVYRWEKGLRPMFPRLAGTIRNRFVGDTLRTYSKADEIAAYHNEGAGKTPKRQFLPPPNMEETMQYLVDLMEGRLDEAWKE